MVKVIYGALTVSLNSSSTTTLRHGAIVSFPCVALGRRMMPRGTLCGVSDPRHDARARGRRRQSRRRRRRDGVDDASLARGRGGRRRRRRVRRGRGRGDGVAPARAGR